MTTTDADSVENGISVTPKIGDIVHFMYGGDHVPAIVTGYPVLPELAGQLFLTVFLPNAAPFTTAAAHGDEIAPQTWPQATWHDQCGWQP